MRKSLAPGRAVQLAPRAAGSSSFGEAELEARLSPAPSVHARRLWAILQTASMGRHTVWLLLLFAFLGSLSVSLAACEYSEEAIV